MLDIHIYSTPGCIGLGKELLRPHWWSLGERHLCFALLKGMCGWFGDGVVNQAVPVAGPVGVCRLEPMEKVTMVCLFIEIC